MGYSSVLAIATADTTKSCGMALTFLLQHRRMFDVELVPELAETLFQHGHGVRVLLGEDCQDSSPDGNSFSQASP